jgi:transcriptional regulator with XRE-family HTH domain
MISKHSRSAVEPLSARVFRFRIARGYSVYELAKAADVLAATVQRLESGKPVDKRVMPALATALDVPLCRLMCGEHSCGERACVLPGIRGKDVALSYRDTKYGRSQESLRRQYEAPG